MARRRTRRTSPNVGQGEWTHFLLRCGGDWRDEISNKVYHVSLKLVCLSPRTDFHPDDWNSYKMTNCLNKQKLLCRRNDKHRFRHHCELRLVADADDIWETDASDPAAPQVTSVSPLRMSSFCSNSISVPNQELFLYKKEQTDVESEMGDCFVYPLFSLSLPGKIFRK